MPTISDAIQHRFEIGDIVNIPIKVTQVSGTLSEPVITGVTQYAGFDGNTDTVGPVDGNQVIVSQ